MENFSAMFATVGSIAVICLIVGQIFKEIINIPNKWTPVFVAIFGGILGAVGNLLGFSEFVNLNMYDAIATGIVSGIASSGVFSLYKNLTDQYEGNK